MRSYSRAALLICISYAACLLAIEGSRDTTVMPRAFLKRVVCHVQAMIETEQAQQAADSQLRAAKAQKERESDEDYQLAKQRAWDDWKDDNPRGAGNSRLKPTA